MKKILSLFALLCALTLSAQSAKLEYNLKKGDKYLIDLKMEQNMAPIMKMEIGITMTTETIGVKNGKIENKSNINRMMMDIAAQGEKVSFDSDKKDAELTEEEKKMKAEIAPALEMLIYQTMDKSGKLLEQKTVPDMPQASNILNQNQITAIVYPKEAVKVGSTWEHSHGMNGINMKMTYKVAQISSTKVLADVTGTITQIGEAKINGKLEINRSTGMPEMMTIDVSAGTQAMGLTMKVEMKAKKL